MSRHYGLLGVLILAAGVVGIALKATSESRRTEAASDSRAPDRIGRLDEQRDADSVEPLDPSLEPERAVASVAARTAVAAARARLEIRIVDASGFGIPGLPVSVFDPADPILTRRIDRRFDASKRLEAKTTDEDGRAVWNDLEPSRELCWMGPVDLRIEYDPLPAEGIGWPSGPFSLKAHETTRLTGHAAQPLSLAGRILDSESKPKSAVLVSATPLDRRSILRNARTDAEGRFVLGPLQVQSLRLEAVLQDHPAAAALLTREVVSPAAGRLEVGDLKPSGRVVRVQLRAIDPTGADVTTNAVSPEGRGLLVQIAGCTASPVSLATQLGGSLIVNGFDDAGCRLAMFDEPPASTCAPGWMIVWTREHVPECPWVVEGDVFFDIPVRRGIDLPFRAPAIHVEGIPDQTAVAVVRVSLAGEEASAAIGFEMRALLGLEFVNVHVVPLGRYHLTASCEAGGMLWRADQDFIVGDESIDPIEIGLRRAR